MKETKSAPSRGSNTSASTQILALSALSSLCRVVLGRDQAWMDGIVRAKRPARLPVVLNREEVQAILGRLPATPRLKASPGRGDRPR